MNYLFLAFIITIIWGTVPFFTKYVLQKIHYKTLILLESILAFFIAMLFCCCNKSEILNDFQNIDALCLLAIIIIGVLIFNANIFYYMIIKDHETYMVNALTSISPLIVLFISYFFLHEKMDGIKILGVFSIVFGVLCLTSR